MLRNLNTEERLELIKKVGEYFLETGESVRSISKHFKENLNIDISSKTVSKYIHEYKKYFGKKEEIDSKISENTSKSIEDNNIQIRMLEAARLALEGKNISQIAKELQVTENIIKTDLNNRLLMYCEQDEDMMIYYNAVKKALSKNMDDSLNDNKVIERVFNVSRLVLQGYTYKEISNILNVSENVIKRDINERLKSYCEQDEDMMIYYNAIKNVLEKNKNSQIEKYNKSI